MKMAVRIWNSVIEGFTTAWDKITEPFIGIAVLVDESRRENLDGSWDGYWEKKNRKLRNRNRRRYLRKVDKSFKAPAKKLMQWYDDGKYSMKELEKLLDALVDIGKMSTEEAKELLSIIHG